MTIREDLSKTCFGVALPVDSYHFFFWVFYCVCASELRADRAGTERRPMAASGVLLSHPSHMRKRVDVYTHCTRC